MTKSEILAICKENQVLSTNLRSFMSKSRKEIKAWNFEKVQKCLKKEEYQQRLKEIKEIESLKAKQFNFSIKELRHLEDKANLILHYFSSGYSMGDYRKIKINGKLFYELDTTEEYSNRCSYRAIHGEFTINFKKLELKAIKLSENKIDWILPNGKKLVESGKKNHYKVELK